MTNKEVKTPKYWEEEIFRPLVKAETAFGNSVMIPKQFMSGWQNALLTYRDMQRLGKNPLDGLEVLKEVNPMYYDLVRVFYEVYETEK